MNYAVSLLLIALIPTVFWVSGKIYSNVLSPISVFLGIWFFTIAMYLLDLVEYLPVEARTWVVLFGAIVAFCFGSAVVTLLWPKAIQQDSEEKLVRHVKPERVTFIFLILSGLGFVGFFTYLVLVGRGVGFDALILQPYLFRAAQSNPDFSTSFQWERTLNYLNVFNFVLGIYIRTTFGIRSRLILACTIGALLTTFFSFERTTPFMAIIWAFFSSHLGNLRVKTLRLGLLVKVACLVVFLVGLFVAVGAWLGKTFENNTDLQKNWRAGEALSDMALPYVYLTGNIAGFQEYMNSYQPGETVGQFTILPLVKMVVLGLGMNHQPPKEVRDFMFIPFAFNTSTFLNVYWSDFGLFGVIVLPFLVGVVSTILYTLSDKTGKLRWTLLAGLFLYALLHSVFVNKFITTPFWLFSSIVAPIAWLIGDKGFVSQDRGAIIPAKST